MASRAAGESEGHATSAETSWDCSPVYLNILDDYINEKKYLEDTGRAVVNILEDLAEEIHQVRDTRSAITNLLEDFDTAKQSAERSNIELRNEIVERGRAEQALRLANCNAEAAIRELDAFSYSIAHDLRAPLRSIDGFSQALVEDFGDVLTDEGKTWVGYVRESAQHMARLIDDLLSLSRVTRTEIRRVPTDLATIARAQMTRLRRDEPTRDVELVCPEQLIAFGDRGLLTAVLDNLLGNAWKFTGKQTQARIELGTFEQDNRTVFFVRDNGAGFNMAYAGKLFAVFQRLHAVSEFPGTGIGLASVERIVRRHGGRVWAEGEVGLGAVFCFTLEEGA